MKIPFHRPIIPENINSIFPDSVLKGWLTTGPVVKSFELLLSEYFDAEHVIAVNSCTAALHLALAAKEFPSGSKFIVPSYTFVASSEIGEYLGMEPVLVDCDENYNIDLNHIEAILKRDNKIKAIVPVHFAGRPVNMKAINSFSDKYGIFILEDAAHALETRSNMGKVGNTGFAAAFSFYANKNITTAGEGGALATNDNELALKIRKLSLHGMSRDGWNRFRIGSKWQYDVSSLGYKYNLTDFAASFGKWQFGNVTNWYHKRTSIFKKYIRHFKTIDGLILPNEVKNGEVHGLHLFIIRINPLKWSICRDKLIIFLNEAGVGTSVHYVPIHMHSYYVKKYNFYPDQFHNSRKFSERVISLPLFPDLRTKEIDYVVKTVKKLWQKYKI